MSFSDINVRLKIGRKVEFAAHYSEDINMLLSEIEKKEEKIAELERVIEDMNCTDVGQSYILLKDLKELLTKHGLSHSPPTAGG